MNLQKIFMSQREVSTGRRNQRGSRVCGHLAKSVVYDAEDIAIVVLGEEASRLGMGRVADSELVQHQQYSGDNCCLLLSCAHCTLVHFRGEIHRHRLHAPSLHAHHQLRDRVQRAAILYKYKKAITTLRYKDKQDDSENVC
jgi:hypothetical protein